MKTKNREEMYDPEKHNRRSLRLKGYDYSSPGRYFITICTHNRQCLFGDVVDGEMVLNKFGKTARNEWVETETIRDNVELDAFVIMPNHMHTILVITTIPGNQTDIDFGTVGAYGHTPLRIGGNEPSSKPKRPFRSPSKTVGAIVRGYKSTVTKQINQICNTPGEKVWQRNYYERVIRNQKELQNVREYIYNNPRKWDEDELK